MTTEKRKRIPKPAPWKETVSLLSWVECLNASTDQEMRAAIEHITKELDVPDDPRFPEMRNPYPILKAKENFDYMRETITFLRDLFRAFARGQWRDDEQKEQLHSLLQRIFPGPTVSEDMRSGANFFLATALSPKNIMDPKTNPCENLRGRLALTIAEAFRDGNALIYSGECPRCGKIFERKQKNAEYCSKACGGADRMKRFRGKLRN